MRPQRGWVGLVVLLVALVIVAWLAQSALRRYGLLAPAVPAAARPGDLPRGPAIGPAPAVDTPGATSAPAAAMERARGLEGAVQQQARELDKRMDEAAK